MESYIKNVREKIPHDFLILHACAVIIPNEKGEILLQQRSDTLMWGLPGGLKELHETLIEAAKREVKEETCLDVEITGLQGVYMNPDMSWFGHDHAEVICTMFIGKVVGGEMKVGDDEGVDLKYFSLENLPKIHSNDNYEAIIDYFKGKKHVVSGVEL